MKKCMTCGSEFSDELSFCKNCGTKLVEAETPAEEAEAKTETEAPTEEAAVKTETKASAEETAAKTETEAPAEETAAETETEAPTEEAAVKTESEAPAEVAPMAGGEAGKGNNTVEKTQEIGKELIEKVKKLPPYVLPAAGAVLVALIIIIIAACCGGKSSVQKISADAFEVLYSEDLEKAVCFNAKGKVFEFGESEESYTELGTSADFASRIMRNGDDTLYLLTIDSFTEIDSDVEYAFISRDGASVAYLVDVESDGTGDLYLYNVKKKSSQKIGSGALASSICLSPDGKTVAYIGDFENYNSFKGMLSVNGKEAESFGKNVYPIAVANKGKYIYYAKGENYSYNLYVACGNDSNKLATDLSSSISIYLNDDYSQILYSFDDKTYISKKGDEKQKLSSNSLRSVVMPDQEASAAYEAYIASVSDSGSSIINLFTSSYKYTISVNSLTRTDFEGSVLSFGSGLYYLNKDYETEKILSSYSTYLFSADGKGIIYLNDDVLYLIKDISKSTEKKTLVEDADIKKIFATDDLSAVYYIDNDETLYYQKGTKDSVKIADDVYFSSVIDREEGTMFFLVDYSYNDDNGVLYYSVNGGKKKKVDNGDEVAGLASFNGSIFYSTEAEDTGYNLYYVKSGTKFKLLLEEIRNY